MPSDNRLIERVIYRRMWRGSLRVVCMAVLATLIVDLVHGRLVHLSGAVVTSWFESLPGGGLAEYLTLYIIPVLKRMPIGPLAGAIVLARFQQRWRRTDEAVEILQVLPLSPESVFAAVFRKPEQVVLISMVVFWFVGNLFYFGLPNLTNPGSWLSLVPFGGSFFLGWKGDYVALHKLTAFEAKMFLSLSLTWLRMTAVMPLLMLAAFRKDLFQLIGLVTVLGTYDYFAALLLALCHEGLAGNEATWYLPADLLLVISAAFETVRHWPWLLILFVTWLFRRRLGEMAREALLAP